VATIGLNAEHVDEGQEREDTDNTTTKCELCDAHGQGRKRWDGDHRPTLSYRCRTLFYKMTPK
jgi:hypothetical protein